MSRILFRSNLPGFRGFAQSETGSITVLGVFIFLVTAMLGAAAVDYSYLIAARTQLQVAADLAAHGTLYYREKYNADEAKQKAMESVAYGMPESRFGEILSAENISFGTWDYETRIFTNDPNSLSAVMVTTSRLGDKLNSVESLLFKLIGIDDFDVSTTAVFTTFRPACFREGFVADGVVDLQSNNNYSKGFCIHSNSYVSLNLNNTYEPGTIVSMPDQTQIDLPNSGFDKNAGLEEALRSTAYRMRVVNRINDIIAGLAARDPQYMPGYITNGATVYLSGSDLDETDFIPGRVHILSCMSDKTTISAATTISEIVLVADCEIKFAQGTVLEDVVMATTSTSVRSFNSPSSFQVGKDDGCLAGGGAQLVTTGGMNFTADLRLFGGQLIAKKAISFSANADGIEGASIISGETIDGTSNMNMGFCNGSGMENNFESDYFRLAQ
ncbi:Tad domain-containing protein [Candidatus Halocynthiibacter alkanivorans]|uniref:Tad domain-containing protein n=1 Tax=Candidatus Halocynthiibacter alkanivorans TaxID=2267619 RepID=UPI001F2B4E55|nr:Tad domain-containing protein [Candidatus Halocynthiibacter alkanivorans]